MLSVRHGVTNLRASPWQVDRLAVTLPVAERAREVMAFHGRWIREFQPHRLTLEHDSFVLENLPRAHLSRTFPGPDHRQPRL